jgi:hypothetical protein
VELSGRPLLGTAADSPLFVDREDELNVVVRSVDLRTNVLVLGSRGSGKTSFLQQVGSRLSDKDFRAVFVEGALASSALELLSLLRYRIAPNVRAAGLVEQAAVVAAAVRTVTSGGTVRRSLEGIPGESEMLLELVRDIGRQLARRERQHVALIDEPQNAEIAHTLFGRLRDELWQLPLVWVVTGNTSDYATYTRPPADAFFHRKVFLEDLDDGMAYELLRRRVSKQDLPDRAVRLIVGEAEGSPRRLVQLANEAVVDGTDVAAVAAAAAQRGRAINELAEPLRRVIAELDANGPASASDSQFLARLGWSRGRAAQVLRDLEELGLVEGAIDRSGEARPRKVYALKTGT